MKIGLLGFKLDPFDDPTEQTISLKCTHCLSPRRNFQLELGKAHRNIFSSRAHTDFIFSIYMEETGLIGLMFLIAIYSIILWRLFFLTKISNGCKFLFQWVNYSYICINILYPNNFKYFRKYRRS